MKSKYAYYTLTLILTLLSGCATATFTQGNPFDGSKVDQIEKEVTTKSEILDLFGAPFTKSLSGEDGEIWIYMYTKGQSKAQSYVFSVDVQTEGTMQKLEILFKGDVVTNFTYTDGGLPGTLNSSIGTN